MLPTGGGAVVGHAPEVDGRSTRSRASTADPDLCASGFGKTTLAEQWRAELTNSGVAVGWLTVDDDDNDVVWFLVHVLEAIDGSIPP